MGILGKLVKTVVFTAAGVASGVAETALDLVGNHDNELVNGAESMLGNGRIASFERVRDIWGIEKNDSGDRERKSAADCIRKEASSTARRMADECRKKASEYKRSGDTARYEQLMDKYQEYRDKADSL